MCTHCPVSNYRWASASDREKKTEPNESNLIKITTHNKLANDDDCDTTMHIRVHRSFDLFLNLVICLENHFVVCPLDFCRPFDTENGAIENSKWTMKFIFDFTTNRRQFCAMWSWSCGNEWISNDRHLSASGSLWMQFSSENMWTIFHRQLFLVQQNEGNWLNERPWKIAFNDEPKSSFRIEINFVFDFLFYYFIFFFFRFARLIRLSLNTRAHHQTDF